MSTGSKLESLIEMGILKGFIKSKKWLAEEVLDVTESALYRWFSKEDVKYKYVQKVCELVGISTEEFYGNDAPENMVNDPAATYKPKSDKLMTDLSTCQQKLEKATLELSHLREQLALKDQIISMFRAQK